MGKQGIGIIDADGRDEGLTGLPLNDPAAFAAWFHDRNRFGGHPWEIMRGGNSTHVDLYVQEEPAGWSFALAGKHRICEVVRAFNALHRAGLPVIVVNAELISAVLTGEAFMYIVPRGIVPKYCYHLFPGEKTEYYMNMPFDVPYAQRRRIIAQAHWYPDKTPAELAEEYEHLLRG